MHCALNANRPRPSKLSIAARAEAELAASERRRELFVLFRNAARVVEDEAYEVRLYLCHRITSFWVI